MPKEKRTIKDSYVEGSVSREEMAALIRRLQKEKPLTNSKHLSEDDLNRLAPRLRPMSSGR